MKGKEPVADFVYCRPNSALWLMPHELEGCQTWSKSALSVSNNSQQEREGAEIGRREGGCGVVKFSVCVCLWF